MKYQPPFGSTDPNAPYLDRSNAGAVRGSVPPGAAIEDPQRELVQILTDRGVVPSETDLGQVSKALAFGFSGNADIPVLGWQKSPPASPALGDRYVVAAGPTGAWAGQAQKVAVWLGAWVFVAPIPGLIANRWTDTRLQVFRFDGSTWAEWLASESAAGPVELATAVETTARTRGDVAVTPLGLEPIIAAAAGRLIGIQIITASGTYTPTPGMTFCICEGSGGGAGGAGTLSPTTTNYVSLGSPGGAGAWGKAHFTAAQIGVSRPVTIGAGGAGGVSAAGGAGGATTLGSLLTLPGGVGGSMLNNVQPPSYNAAGGLAVSPTGANIASNRGISAETSSAISAFAGLGGSGGSGPLGSSGRVIHNATGFTGVGYGAGGSGAVTLFSGPALVGGGGAPGILIILEYGA